MCSVLLEAHLDGTTYAIRRPAVLRSFLPATFRALHARGSPIYIVYYAIGSHRPHRAKYFTGEAISCIMHALCQRTKQSKDQAKPRDHGTKFPSRVPREPISNLGTEPYIVYYAIGPNTLPVRQLIASCMHCVSERSSPSQTRAITHTARSPSRLESLGSQSLGGPDSGAEPRKPHGKPLYA